MTAASGPDAIRLMNIAAGIAREAGNLVAAGRRAGLGLVATKSSPTDLVTHWDTRSETLIRSRVRAARPRDGIVGEEGEASPSSTGITWFVDPIDGTTNFAYGLSAYAVSIAAVDADGPIAAAIHAPESRELFVAARGFGAWNKGRKLACSAQTDLSLALVATGFSYDRRIRSEQMQFVARHLGSMRDIRRVGAACLDLCSVADGRVDAYFERGVRPWDVAAGALIARESGAIVSDPNGNDLTFWRTRGSDTPVDILVSSPGIHQQLSSLFG